jgi:hypothetical protein
MAYTDATGNYTIAGIRYNGNGENFKAVPAFGVHSFSPASQVLYIGDGSTVLNGTNFTDNSAFRVRGSLYYDTTKFKKCTCPVPNAFVNVDGNPVVINGSPAMTKADGSFDISVPIGQHVITVSQSGHSYRAGRYPPISIAAFHDFQDSLSGLTFFDSTSVKVIGRVVGGTRESAKAMILGKSKNNLGVARVIFHSQSGCYRDTAFTDVVHGDYQVALPPMAYTVDNVTIANNASANTWPEFATSAIDVTNIPQMQEIKDSVFTYAGHNKVYSHLDSGSYQLIKSYVRREAPSIWVRDNKGRDFANFGADTNFRFTNPKGVDTVYHNVTNSTFGYPIFTQGNTYLTKMGAVENYINSDATTPVKDSVPVTTGVFTVNNALSDSPGPYDIKQDTAFISMLKDTAYVTYPFHGGNPNIAYDPALGADNFLQTFNVDFVSGPNTVHWKPRAGGNSYQGILLGGQSSDGQGFVSSGPSVVEYVLRDPPGTDSYTSLEVGSTITSNHGWSNEGDIGIDMNKRIKVGTEFSAGIGVSTKTDIHNEIRLNAKVETKVGGEGEDETTVTTTQAWSTDASSGHVGSNSDVYIGRAMNLNFGVNQNIAIVPQNLLPASSSIQKGATGTINGKTLQVISRKSLCVLPQGYATTFSYTQDYIVNTLVPNLTTLRNQLFVNEPLKYKATLMNINDPRYGTNNDDPVWGTTVGATGVSSANPFTTILADTTGQSYTYHAGKTSTTVHIKSTTGGDSTISVSPGQSDSVRWYNQQIRLWKSAVSDNERDKVLAKANAAKLVQNQSISEGVEYESTTETEDLSTRKTTFEIAISGTAALRVGAEIGGSGIDLDQSITLGYTHGGSSTTTNSHKTSWHYKLSDKGAGDYFSTDVRTGDYSNWSPSFNLTGGQTRCPYEGTDSTVYYTDPTTHKHVAMNQATLRTEKVSTKVDGNLKFSLKTNIPSAGQAVYNLEIDNLTESVPALAVAYSISVPASLNPKGAVLTIDGYNPANQLYTVPGGQPIYKQLVLKRGAVEFNYDSVAVVIGSACGDGVVSDTIYVSAHFLPACTDVNITYPLDKWVLNNSFGNKLNTVLAGYDINYNGLKEITFDYKPSSSASWIPLRTWYKDSVGAKAIPTTQAYISYPWDVLQTVDDHYDLRITSACSLKVGNQLVLATAVSPVVSGVIDRINPAPFGTPSPGTGILNPGEDISIQFNKPLEGGALTKYNFDVRGVLNGAAVAHSTSLSFDGTSSYAEVVGGASLQKRDFTFEFWAKRSVGGEMAVISQDPDATQALFIGFNSSNQLALRFGSVEVAGDKAAGPVDNNWHHYAVTYNDTAHSVAMFADFFGSGTANLNSITNMAPYYSGAGRLYFGMDVASNGKFFNGNLQEIRLWNKALLNTEISSRMNTVLGTNTGNLLYDWRMDEATGTTASDAIRSRNATLVNTTWQITPNGYACAFDGSTGEVQIGTPKLGITKEMDFTLEFWFKSNQAGVSTLFSNGNGDGLGADSTYAWVIQKDNAGMIHVLHDKIDFVATSSNYFDNTWHHFALVMQRASTLSAYIDGLPQNSMASSGFQQMGGANMFLGVHGYMVGSVLTKDQHFQGSIDEFRFWNVSRLIKQIARDKQNRMTGDEAGLKLYLPFEDYLVVLGIPQMNPIIRNFSMDSLVVTNTAGATTTSQTPTLKLPRPVQSLTYSYSLNTDKIIITSNMSPADIENVTLDITVENVQDLDGNHMQSPKTWIAYINQNQVKWQDQGITLNKTLGAALTFNATIVNSGGSLKAFTIGNMPSWLSVNKPTGTLSPNSTQQLTFTIDQGVNIGDYTQDITLTTDFNFPEKYTLALKVAATPPTWSVNPSNFQYSEGIIGQIRIDGITSTNPDDKLAAFSKGICRGVTNLNYYPAYDKYYAVMDVYSNSNSGDTITFKVWNAAEGKEHTQIIPATLIFSADSVRGTYIKPQFFDASFMLTRTLPLKAGWNWVSANVLCPDSTNLNKFMGSLHPHTGDILVGQTGYSDYSSSFGWTGSLSAPTSGIKIQSSYRIDVAAADTLVFSGKQVDPTTKPITLTTGWNWVGFVSLRNLPVKDALANLNAKSGDVIKSQTSFALYDSTLGWSGSLAYMVPNQGYMLRSKTGGTFVYPISGINGKRQIPAGPEVAPTWKVNAGAYDNNMNVVARLDCGGNPNHRLTLGAFVNGECRGVVPVSVDANTEGVFYLTLFANKPETIVLLLRDEQSGKVYELDNAVNFQSDAMQGNLQMPLALKLKSATLDAVCSKTAASVTSVGNFSIDPIPCGDLFTMHLKTNTAGRVHLRISSVTGQLIHESDFDVISGMNATEMSSDALNMTPGMYIVELTTTEEKVVTRLIKK